MGLGGEAFLANFLKSGANKLGLKTFGHFFPKFQEIGSKGAGSGCGGYGVGGGILSVVTGSIIDGSAYSNWVTNQGGKGFVFWVWGSLM